jgi:hypothetical protein
MADEALSFACREAAEDELTSGDNKEYRQYRANRRYTPKDLHCPSLCRRGIMMI